MTDSRLPPQNLQAEKSCLGSQLLDARTVDVVRGVIGPSDYYADVHAKIQKAIIKLRDGGSELDPVTISEQLNATGDLQDIGGVSYIVELIETVPHSAHAKYYAEAVGKCSRRRKAIAVARKLMESAYDPSNNESEVSQAAINAATDLAAAQVGVSNLRPMSEVVQDLIVELGTGVTPSVRVMIPEVDSLTGGAAPGEMFVIGARPSHGKTLFALQCLDSASAHGWAGLIVSEEMTAGLLASRSLASLSVVPSIEWMGQTDRLRFDAREHYATRAPILIAEKCGTASGAERAIAEAVRSHQVKIVAVDYAQLLRGEGDNEQERIADVSQRMKAAAVRHGVIMLLLAQLNRGIESRENPEPGLADLRGSGSLEQDGDVILFPFWPAKIDASYPNKTEYRIYQRKNRNRGVSAAVLQMRINADRQRIEAEIPAREDDGYGEW